MNERIKQLSIEAGFPEWSNHAIEFELEKFAELIVQECLDVLNPDDDLTSMREEYGRKLSMNMIKEHFGVE